jgi:hypothetical protein
MVDCTVRLFIGASHTTVASTRPAALPVGALMVTSVAEVMDGPALRVFVAKGSMYTSRDDPCTRAVVARSHTAATRVITQRR